MFQIFINSTSELNFVTQQIHVRKILLYAIGMNVLVKTKRKIENINKMKTSKRTLYWISKATRLSQIESNSHISLPSQSG